MQLWLPKPAYEFVPWFHLGAGVLLLLGPLALPGGWLPLVSFVTGLVLVASGAFLAWRRRAWRRSH